MIEKDLQTSNCEQSKECSSEIVEEVYSKKENSTLSGIIGDFGLLQFIVVLFLSIREGTTAYDSVVTSVILKPVEGYLCLEGDFQPANRSSPLDQCYVNANHSSYLLDSAGEMVKCTRWSFRNLSELDDKASQLPIEWQLVCDRQWLLSLVESIFFVGVVLGNLFWGYLSDTYGRKRAYLLSHLLTLLMGLSSLYIRSYWLFVACRFLHGFGQSGYFILYVVMAEVVGAKVRNELSVVSHAGWGAFLVLLPYINNASTDYRHLLSLSPIVSLITLPAALWIPESFRLLMAKGDFAGAREILWRIVRINKVKISEADLNERMEALEKEVSADLERASEERRGKNLYGVIFTSPSLVKDTLIMCYICFLAQMLYFILTLNFYFIENVSVEDNFLKSGVGEWIGIAVLIVLLKCVTRRTSLRIFFSLLIVSFCMQYMIDIGLLDSLNTRWFVVINNGLGNLCTANLLFLTFSVMLEVYPTVARDTGKSIVCSTLELGSTSAPFIIQLGKLVGNDKVNLSVVIMSSLGLFLSEFLTLNDNSELSNV